MVRTNREGVPSEGYTIIVEGISTIRRGVLIEKGALTEGVR